MATAFELNEKLRTIVMKSFAVIAFIIVLSTAASSWVLVSTQEKEAFLQCLLNHDPQISSFVYTETNSSYSSILDFSIQNVRFLKANAPKPVVIITPSHVSHIQAAVVCSRAHGLQIRTRSGGHDFEGLSYISTLPFVIVDLINMRSIAVDVQTKSAWVQSGATLGELYYRIGKKSQRLAFPAGSCPTVGVGGHLSGGGYGWLVRKYGLAADNVMDAYLVDANGEFHDRKSMGEDLFWAIRGGGGGSFGIVVAWKLKLVPVPPTVTTCGTNRTLEEDTMKLIHRWQYVAPKLGANLLLGISLTGGSATEEGGKTKPTATFSVMFLGKADEVMAILKATFSELGLAKEDCKETSWIESTLITAAGFQETEAFESLLNRKPIYRESSKIKSDYVKEPISKVALKGMWGRLKSQDVEVAQIMLIPYGGRMSEISEGETPYSHRADYLYKIGYIVKWQEGSVEYVEKRHVNWIREIYDYMTPFVSKSPRAAYINYRDLDIGANNLYGKTSYERARVWGFKCFGNNFDRLVHVKTKVDPNDFFRHEQSIPTLTHR